MEMEKRLVKLVADINLERSKVLITFWPEDIKKEAVYLTSIFGIEKILETTKLNKGTLLSWIRKYEKEGINFLQNELENKVFEEDKISVTRIIANPNEVVLKEEPHTHIASIMKNNIELKIYCKDMVEKLAERFFI